MGTYHGPGTSLILQQGDKLTVNPSQVATLIRSYSCIDGYVATARGTLIPGHVPDGYPNMSMTEPPQETSQGGITTFSCKYMGLTPAGSLHSPIIQTRATLQTFTQSVVEYELVDGVDTPVVSSLSYRALANVYDYFYASDGTVSPLGPLTTFSDEFNWVGPVPNFAGATYSATLENFTRTPAGPYVEETASWVSQAQLGTLYGPHQQVIPPITYTGTPSSGGSITVDAVTMPSGEPVSFNVTGHAAFASGTTAINPTINVTGSVGQTFTINALSYSTIPAGYNFLTDYDPANPTYYYAPASISLTVTIS